MAFLSELDQMRERDKRRRMVEQEVENTLRPMLNSPGWDAFERLLSLDLEEIVESLASANEPFDIVRFKQGRIAQIRMVLQKKKELLSSST